LCGTERDQCISRHHCQLYFAPPTLCVQDLQSSNGTYVNGHKLEEQEMVCHDALSFKGPIGFAQDGDVLTIGGTSLQVHVLECALADAHPETDVASLPGCPVWNENEIVKKDCPVAC
jgi:pSer/pThr/pTyr-binding forkhead associated (FHA) protein